MTTVTVDAAARTAQVGPGCLLQDEDHERIRASYGANFERLVEIKTKYDPDNLFRVNRNVAPAAVTGR